MEDLHPSSLLTPRSGPEIGPSTFIELSGNAGYHQARHTAYSMMLRKPRLLLGAANAPRWARLYVHPIEDFWSVMVVDEDEPAPEPEELKGLVLFGRTVDEAETNARTHLGLFALKN